MFYKCNIRYTDVSRPVRFASRRFARIVSSPKWSRNVLMKYIYIYIMIDLELTIDPAPPGEIFGTMLFLYLYGM